MLDASLCNYLHYVWMLYHVGLIQKYIFLSCCSIFIYAKHQAQKNKSFLSSNSADDTRSPWSCSFSCLGVFLSSPPAAQMSSQFHSSTFPSQVHLVFQTGSIPSHPTHTDLESGIVQLHLNLFSCCVLVSSLSNSLSHLLIYVNIILKQNTEQAANFSYSKEQLLALQ